MQKSTFHNALNSLSYSSVNPFSLPVSGLPVGPDQEPAGQQVAGEAGSEALPGLRQRSL